MNCIDGVGGLGIGEGAPEIVTGSRDGMYFHTVYNIIIFLYTISTGYNVFMSICILINFIIGTVKVWDPRQKDIPVANMESVDEKVRRDCWCVAFGM